MRLLAFSPRRATTILRVSPSEPSGNLPGCLAVRVLCRAVARSSSLGNIIREASTHLPKARILSITINTSTFVEAIGATVNCSQIELRQRRSGCHHLSSTLNLADGARNVINCHHLRSLPISTHLRQVACPPKAINRAHGKRPLSKLTMLAKSKVSAVSVCLPFASCESTLVNAALTGSECDGALLLLLGGKRIRGAAVSI